MASKTQNGLRELKRHVEFLADTRPLGSPMASERSKIKREDTAAADGLRYADDGSQELFGSRGG